jgi:hypothetical protein
LSANDPVTVVLPEQLRTEVSCPIEGCLWRHLETPAGPAVDGIATLESFYEAIGRSLLGQARDTEAHVRAHLDTHSVLDFVRTISALRGQLAAHRALAVTV